MAEDLDWNFVGGGDGEIVGEAFCDFEGRVYWEVALKGPFFGRGGMLVGGFVEGFKFVFWGDCAEVSAIYLKYSLPTRNLLLGSLWVGRGAP